MMKTLKKQIVTAASSALQALKSRNVQFTILTASSMTAAMVPADVWAIAVPAVGSFAYDVYDVAVNQILKGPIGFVAGMAAIVFGAAQLMKSWPIAIMGILAGTVLLKADAITVSLGMVV